MRNQLELDLRVAIERQQIAVVYQRWSAPAMGA